MTDTQQEETKFVRETPAQIRARIDAEVQKNMRGSALKPTGKNEQYPFIVTKAKKVSTLAKGDKKGNGKDCPQFVLDVSPLTDDTDTASAQGQLEESVWLLLPVINPDIEGHTVSVDALKSARWEFRAFFSDRLPHVEAPTKGSKDQDAWAAYNAAIEAQLPEVINIAYDILEGKVKLENMLFYASTTTKTNGKGGYFINTKSAEPLPGKVVGVPEELVS